MMAVRWLVWYHTMTHTVSYEYHAVPHDDVSYGSVWRIVWLVQCVAQLCTMVRHTVPYNAKYGAIQCIVQYCMSHCMVPYEASYDTVQGTFCPRAIFCSNMATFLPPNYSRRSSQEKSARRKSDHCHLPPAKLLLKIALVPDKTMTKIALASIKQCLGMIIHRLSTIWCIIW